MKTKILATLLMLTLLLTTAVCAAPVLTDVVESTEETASDYSETETSAEVMAAVPATNVKPGINIYTGDTSVLTFDSNDYAASSFSFGAGTITNENGAITVTYNSTGGWNGFRHITNKAVTVPSFAYMRYKAPTNLSRSSFTLYDVSGNPSVNITRDNEWHELIIANGNYIFNSYTHAFWGTCSADQSWYVDDFVLVPYYKITYKNLDNTGASLGADIETYFIAEDPASVKVENGVITGIATSYKPTQTLANTADYAFAGWSTTEGGAKEETIALNNADLVLYPVWEEIEKVTVNYKDSNGNLIYSNTVVPNSDSSVQLLTSANLGLDYEAVYTYEGKKYYPGMSVKVGENDAIDVVVSNTRVVFSESFDNQVVSDSKNTHYTTIAPEYYSPLYAENGFSKIDSSYPAANTVVGITGGDQRTYQYYKTTTESGRGVLQLTKTTGGNQHFTFYVWSGDIGDGVYEYAVTYKTDGSSEIETSTIALVSKIDAKTSMSYEYNNEFVTSDAGDGYRKIVFTYEIYTDATTGKKMIKFGTVQKEYVSEVMNKLHLYWTGDVNSVTTDKVYLDDISIEYTPYTPGEVNLISYRDDEPVGIRFASYVDNKQVSKCTEYGFIATRKTFLEAAAAENGGEYEDYLYIENDDVLGTTTTTATNDDGVLMVGAAAYSKTDKIDRVYATDGADFGSKKYFGLNDAVKFFTGVVTGLNNADKQAEVFVVRPYIKVEGKYYFGAAYESSFNQVYNANN